MDGGVNDASYAGSQPNDSAALPGLELIQSLLETINSRVLVCDAQGRMTVCTGGAREALGWPASFAPMWCTDLDPSIGDPLLRALAGETLTGRELPGFRVSAHPLLNADGAKLGAVLVIDDISEQRKAWIGESHVSNVLEIIGDAFMSFDHQWRYIYMNAKAAELTGRSKEEMLGKNVWEEFPEATKGAFYRELHRAVAEQRHIHFENYYPPLSKWFENDAYPDTTGISVFYRDITERKRIEHDLARKAEELTRSNADLQQFTYAVSHDLQEPLRTVMSFTQILMKRFSGKLDQDSEELLSDITKGAARMRDMIRDLLLFSRVTQEGDAWFGPVNLEEVLEWAVENLQIAIGESGAVITHDPLPVVFAIALQMRQLFQNLIGNALKYRGAEPPRIHISAMQDWGVWSISFEDNGIGIDQSQQDRIFGLFKRAQTGRQYEGTGVGLALCRRIAERHGGSLGVESTPGKGSTFHLVLPAGLTGSSSWLEAE